MSIFDNPDQLRLLQNLLYPPENKRNSDSDTDDGEDSLVVRQRSNNNNRANFENNDTLKVTKEASKSPYAPAKDVIKENALPKTMEEWEKQQQQEQNSLDSRKCPEYTMTYRQAIGTEDVFLQMGNRNNSTASCEDLLLDIHLPDETVTVEKMNLLLTETEIDVATPIYHLKLPLAHKINVDRCRAKYDTETRKLHLILRLKREFDFVNF